MNASTIRHILIILIGSLAVYPAMAQETTFELHDVLDLPPGLNPERKGSCSIEFQEQWTLHVARLSILKEVHAFGISCKDTAVTVNLPEGTVRLKDLSYEFSFLDLLDLLDSRARDLQETLIALINSRNPIPESYDPAKQLLSVYFHEDWIIDTDRQLITKKVNAITPVIWQERQTADGKALPDGETGYPVYYKLKLSRIDLRNP